ncbi:MAG: ParB-like nuclease domain-containing protein [Lachnospiraceae bacterium]|jgi:ParB-like chromosome segregation protein Spo0J|nr:ParB-like nuclease domain-containing protein [Lachnospiraceae bacterium]
MVSRSPVYGVVAVPIEKIEPNTYNPNAVAPPELRLLYDSIKEDGYTMPVVCYYDRERDKYILVDGFHRYRIMLDYPDIYKREGGMLPVSVIDKPLDHRMASTIRHNRARGSHDVDLMSNIVKELHELGRSDAWISRHLGMDRDEILRLKQITGLAALFRDVEFGRAWQPVEAETVVEGGAVKVMDGEAAVALEEEEENGEDESD